MKPQKRIKADKKHSDPASVQAVGVPHASRVASDLAENSRGFLREATAYAGRGSKQDWVFAVVHLAVGLELLFKTILQLEHWSLLFEDANSASMNSYQSGDFKSVTYKEALRRCREISELAIEPKDLRYLEDLHDLRNRVLHYKFDLNVEQIKGIVARGLNIAIHLMTGHLPQETAFANEISTRLAGFDRYVQERLRRLQQHLIESERPPKAYRECEKCRQETLVITDTGEPLCLFCGAETDARELASGSEGDCGPCPNCDTGRLACELFNNEDGRVICVICGFEAESSRNRQCNSCGEEFWDDVEGSGGVCSNCFAAYLNKD